MTIFMIILAALGAHALMVYAMWKRTDAIHYPIHHHHKRVATR